MSTISDDLKEANQTVTISGQDCQMAKTLEIKWNVTTDSFQISVAQFSRPDVFTKRIFAVQGLRYSGLAVSHHCHHEDVVTNPLRDSN